MKDKCPICDRNLGKAYHGKKIRRNFCCRKCENYFKEHFCVMHKSGEPKSHCSNKIFKSVEKFCSNKCKDDFFKKGKKPFEYKICSVCSIKKYYVDFRLRGRGWKSPNGVYRQSYCRVCESQALKDKRDKNPAQRLFMLARIRSKRDKLNFDLTEEYIKSIWPTNNKCPIFNTEFKSGLKNKNVLPTLDKVIPEKGYVKGNVAIISFVANRMKSDVKDVTLFKKLYDFYKNFK